MLHLVKTTNSDELNFEINYPDVFHDPESQITELSFSTGQRYTQGNHCVNYFDNMSIILSKVNSKEKFPLQLTYDFSVVVLEFMLSTKQMLCSDELSGTSVLFHGGQHNVIFTSVTEFSHDHLASDNIEVVRIHVSTEYYKRLLPDRKLFDEFHSSIEKGKFSVLFPVSMPITPAMYIVLKEIQTADRKGVFKRILLEAKVLELIMLQFEQYEALRMNDTGMIASHVIRRDDIRKMQEVKEILQQNLQSPHSLVQLAHIVGTNVYTLKKNFKECFGITVFGYLNQIRMEEAQRLLMTNSLSINQVADLIGYKNANHFSTAFKRYFGYIPSNIKSGMNDK